MTGKRLYVFLIGSFVLTSSLFYSCNFLKDMADVKNPVIKIEKAQISDFSFHDVKLLFDVSIHNPNSISANLKGYEYDFKINKKTFLRGEQSSDVAIRGNETSYIQIPMTLQFNEIYKTFDDLAGQDSMDYQILAGVFIDLPVVGLKKLPVSKSGILPVVRIPKIKVDKVRLTKIGLTGADLNLDIQIENPNIFDLAIDRLNYNLTVNDKGWAEGQISNTLEIKNNEQGVISLPIELDFLEMGQSVYQMLIGQHDLNYELKGDLSLRTSYQLMKNLNLPIVKSGKLSIIK